MQRFEGARSRLDFTLSKMGTFSLNRFFDYRSVIRLSNMADLPANSAKSDRIRAKIS
jgi:hypothetical protein